MSNRHQSAWRRRRRGSRGARLTVTLAIPVALGLAIGAAIAFYAGSHNANAAGGPAPSPLGSVTATPAGTAASPVVAVNANNVNCDIIVPANPLTAKGLATPYLLTGTKGMSPAQSGCAMTNAVNLGAFVQATILDPATGQLWVYDPLVITKGTTPAVQPSVPDIPADSIVTLDFGFNGTDLFQVGATPDTLKDANCVDGQPGSIFGQVSYCNGPAFFAAASSRRARAQAGDPVRGHLAEDDRHRRRDGDGERVPGHPELRDRRPGPVRQRDHRVPAEPGHRPDHAGHHVQRGQRRGLHPAAQRQ